MILKPVLFVAAVSMLASGCVVHDEVRYRNPPPPVVVQPAPPPSGEVVVTGAPPPPIEETIVVAPDPAFVWVGGAWEWRGRWVWAPGHWMRPPRRGVVWVGSHYELRGGRHVYVRGYWR